MAFEERTLDEITLQLYEDMALNMCDGDPSFVSHKIIGVISKAVGFAIWANQQFSLRYGRTLFDSSGPLLDSYAEECGVVKLRPEYSGGFINVSGSGIIPEGTIFTRCDGLNYETIREETAPGQILVIAQNPGCDYNTPNGSTLNIASSVAGVNPTATVANTGLAGGSDLESDESYKQRVIACFANKCRNGLTSDYEYWTRLYAGVTRVCVIPKANGPGTVKVFFAMDDTYANSIPSQQDVENVQDIFDQNVPDGICVTACAMQTESIDVQIRLLDASNLTTRQNISDAIQEALKLYQCGEFCYSDLYRIIGDNYQGCFEIVSPTSDFILTTGQVPVAGTISFVL